MPTELYRLVVRNSQGQLVEKIDCLENRLLSAIHQALNQGFSVTVVKTEMKRVEIVRTSELLEAHPPPKSDYDLQSRF